MDIKNHFGNNQIRKYLVAFASVFSEVPYFSKTTGLIKTANLVYGSQNQFVSAFNKEDDMYASRFGNVNRVGKGISLPAISFSLTGMTFSVEKRRAPMDSYVAGLHPDGYKTYFQTMIPTPFDITTEVILWAASDNECFEMMEQILPYFNSPLVVDIELFPGVYNTKINVKLESIETDLDPSTASIGAKCTLTFSFTAWLYTQPKKSHTNKKFEFESLDDFDFKEYDERREYYKEHFADDLKDVDILEITATPGNVTDLTSITGNTPNPSPVRKFVPIATPFIDKDLLWHFNPSTVMVSYSPAIIGRFTETVPQLGRFQKEIDLFFKLQALELIDNFVLKPFAPTLSKYLGVNTTTYLEESTKAVAVGKMLMYELSAEVSKLKYLESKALAKSEFLLSMFANRLFVDDMDDIVSFSKAGYFNILIMRQTREITFDTYDHVNTKLHILLPTLLKRLNLYINALTDCLLVYQNKWDMDRLFLESETNTFLADFIKDDINNSNIYNILITMYQALKMKLEGNDSYEDIIGIDKTMILPIYDSVMSILRFKGCVIL